MDADDVNAPPRAICGCTACVYDRVSDTCGGQCQLEHECRKVVEREGGPLGYTLYYTADADRDLVDAGGRLGCACVRRDAPTPPPTPPRTRRPTPPPPTTAVATTHRPPSPPSTHSSPPPVPCCPGPTRLDVVEYTQVRVRQDTCEGQECTYVFEVDVNFARSTANVVSFWPISACSVRNRTACDNVATNFTETFCQFYGTTRANWLAQKHLYEANGWSATLEGAHSNAPFTRFTRSFTLSELVACGAITPSLVSGGATLEYAGTLYVGAVHASDCAALDASPGGDAPAPAGACDTCDLRFVQPYRFEIDYATNGTLTTSFGAKNAHFTIRWLNNEWLPSGDITVKFETCVAQLVPPTGGMTHLVRPRASDVPGDDDPDDGASLLDVIDISDCLPTIASHHDLCCQIVTLASHNSSADNYSGDRLLTFDVEDVPSGTQHGSVLAHVELSIERGDAVTHFEAQAQAEIKIFRDRGFSRPYSCESQRGASFMDCEEVCVLVTVPCPPGVILALDAGELCTSDRADPAPFDPERPDTTGCNTPSIDLRVYDLFDTARHFAGPGFNVTFVHDPPSHPWQVGFCFKAHTLSYRAQLLQVHYHLLLADGSHAPRSVRGDYVPAFSTGRKMLSLSLDSGAHRPKTAGARRRSPLPGSAPGAITFARDSALDDDETRLGARLVVTCVPPQVYHEPTHRCVDPWWGDDDDDEDERPHGDGDSDRDGDRDRFWRFDSDDWVFWIVVSALALFCLCGFCIPSARPWRTQTVAAYRRRHSDHVESASSRTVETRSAVVGRDGRGVTGAPRATTSTTSTVVSRRHANVEEFLDDVPLVV